MHRRHFLRTASLTALAPLLPATSQAWGLALSKADGIIKPPRLKTGDVVGLAAPAGAVRPEGVQQTVDALAQLGLRAKVAPNALARYGYLGGTDADRAADLHTLFADREVNAVLALRGGWGVARLLPHLDFALLRRHPKIVCGYSDITALLLAIHARTGLVTFHGPVGTSTWNLFSTGYFRRVLMEAEPVVMGNPVFLGGVPSPQHPVETITPGAAQGRLLGGNLTVLTALIGSLYLPDWNGAILFLEDTGEDVYRIDRMLTQLKLAGILDKLGGFVFGRCTRCDAAADGFTLMEVLHQHIAPLGIPAWYGSMIGHIADKFTVPLGTLAEADATTGRIRLLEAAVT